MPQSAYDCVVIGGGPGGSAAALFLLRAGFRTCIVEKKTFPRETVCGEFLSREVVRTFERLGIFDSFLVNAPNPLRSFRYCPRLFGSAMRPFAFPAYAMKRGTFDAFLLDEVRRAGGEVLQPWTVEGIARHPTGFALSNRGSAGTYELTARWIVGAFGKAPGPGSPQKIVPVSLRPRLNGVKFHVPRKLFPHLPSDEIQLYAGRNMYCGLNVVSEQTVTMSFLERRKADDINPRDRIRDLMVNNMHFAGAASPELADAVESLPVHGVGAIDFGEHPVFRDGIFLTGDAARVIAPLAGDGIGMAMQSGELLAATLAEGQSAGWSDMTIGREYERRWNVLFRRRLRRAMQIQKLLLSRTGSEIGGMVVSVVPRLLSHLIESTRG